MIGAGVFGASLARRLAGNGWEVAVVDPHPPGHVRAASGHESRLIRFAHGSDRWYTRSAWRARDLWRELEEETGRSLLLECGVAWFALSEDGWETQSERVLTEEGIPVERLGPRRSRRALPEHPHGRSGLRPLRAGGGRHAGA